MTKYTVIRCICTALTNPNIMVPDDSRLASSLMYIDCYRCRHISILRRSRKEAQGGGRLGLALSFSYIVVLSWMLLLLSLRPSSVTWQAGFSFEIKSFQDFQDFH